jgi:molybdopterin converting factor small subunit
MALVKLSSPLRELADGSAEVRVEGSTVGEVIAGLERSYPRLAGWVLDERRRIRQHVVVFLNGERAEEAAGVSPNDRMHVLPSISGGAVTAVRPETELLEQELELDTEEEPTELLVGTRKGLFILRGRRGRPPEEVHRKFSGQVVEYAINDGRTDTYFASVTHGQFGPRLYRSQDPLGEWEQAHGPAFPEDAGAAVERIWVVEPGLEEGVLWAGVAPAALFKSEDGGASWTLNRPLWDHPSRKEWQPGAGGLCLHSICTWPADPSRLAIGISAAGVWLSEDGGGCPRRLGRTPPISASTR